jgi:flagellar M-ring protein FliF
MNAVKEQLPAEGDGERSLRQLLPVDLQQPWVRRLLLIGVLAVSLTAIVSAVLLVNRPPYRPLYSGMEARNLAEIAEALDRLALPYRIDERTGALQVPADQMHRVRLQLAGEGLPRSGGDGFELLDEPGGFGVSQFMENARYQRALEGELARSVASIGSVRQARVHLAMSRPSVFVRDRRPPSASVVVRLEPGRVLDTAQVAAMTHLVSSSVPDLTPQRVTVVDQLGSLLSSPNSGKELGLSHEQLDFTNKLQQQYARRIEELLIPIVGHDAVRAQVAIEVDFNSGEETEESFLNPDNAGVRSEQLREERSSQQGRYGIPGALSNEPPAPSQVGGEADTDPNNPRRPFNERVESTRNYELDKRVRYLRRTPGRVLRVSAAVVLDDKLARNDAGELAREPFSPEELERLTGLVRQAVGFDEARGDRVDIVNTPFASSEFDSVNVDLPWWQTGWFLDMVRTLLVALFALLVLLLIVRPAVRGLVRRTQVTVLDPDDPAQLTAESMADAKQGRRLDALALAEGDDLEDDVVRLSSRPTPLDPTHPTDLNGRVRVVKDLVSDDPRRAVQVVKQWMSQDA